MKLTISGNPITKKNSQRIIRCGRFTRIAPSKQYEAYLESARKQLRFIGSNIETPVNIRCLYYMATRRKCDLVNLLEATCDILKDEAIAVIKDDHCGIVVAHDGSRVLYDKDDPRVEIEITPMTML